MQQVTDHLRGQQAFDEAMDAGYLRFVQSAVGKWGGISGGPAVARRAGALGIAYCPHWLAGGVGLAASMHALAPSGSEGGYAEVDANSNPLREEVFPLEIDDGWVTLTDAPGLGVEPDLRALSRFVVAHLHDAARHVAQAGTIRDNALPSVMRKTFQLTIEGKKRERVLDSVKNEFRKYVKRERRRELPEGADYWDFDCRFGLSQEAAQVAHLATLASLIDAAARDGAQAFYLEILARPAKRKVRPAAAPTAESPAAESPPAETSPAATSPAESPPAE